MFYMFSMFYKKKGCFFFKAKFSMFCHKKGGQNARENPRKGAEIVFDRQAWLPFLRQPAIPG